MTLRKRNAFTLTEIMIVITILMVVIGMLFFIITFIFQTMYRINFNIETISTFETVQSRLDSVFSMWYIDVGEENSGAVFEDSARTIKFSTKKIAEEDGALKTLETNVTVSFSTETHSLLLSLQNNDDKTLIQDNYIEDVEFGTSTVNDYTITATITFTSPNGKVTEQKFTKFKTLNVGQY